MGAIGDTDDEGIDNRGYCDTRLGFQRHWQDYPRKSRAKQPTVDPMDHLGVGVHGIYGEPELSRGQNRSPLLPHAGWGQSVRPIHTGD